MLRRVWGVLSSVWIGLFLLLNLGGMAAFLTIRYPSPEPYFLHPLYQSLLGAFGVNIACVLIDRYRFRLAQLGFLLTHVGIVTILTGGAMTHWLGEDGQMQIPEGGSGDAFMLERARGMYLVKELRLAGPDGARADQAFDAAPPARLPRFEACGVQVTVLDHVPKGMRRRTPALLEDGESLVRIRVGMAVASVEEWLQADDEDLGELEVGNRLRVRFRRIAARAEGPALDPFVPSDKSLSLLQGPDGSLALIEADGKGKHAVHTGLAKGGAVACTLSPLKLDILDLATGLLLDDVVPSPDGPEEFLRLRLERDGDSRDLWTVWNEPVHADVGKGTVFLRFGNPQRPLGFSLRLEDFRKRDYEGSAIPMSYESHLRLDDPEQGVKDRPVVIRMNEPLVYRGWTFFQAAFSSTGRPGDAEVTVLQVSRDPGKPIVYTGALLVVSGIITMFYVKPWLKRRGWL